MSDLMRSARYAAEKTGNYAAGVGMPGVDYSRPQNFGVAIEKVNNGFVVGGHPFNHRDEIALAMTIDEALSIARKRLSEL